MARPKPLQCPYCDNFLRRPLNINIKSIDVSGGICPCGAVYVLDETAHAMGEIFMDALTLACRGDLDKSLTLNPEDYESIDYDYDMHANTIGRGGGGGKLGKLIFIRLND